MELNYLLMLKVNFLQKKIIVLIKFVKLIKNGKENYFLLKDNYLHHNYQYLILANHPIQIKLYKKILLLFKEKFLETYNLIKKIQIIY